MSSTNKTANYELSQYIGSDKPTYLVDYNGDMLKIDTGMAANKAQADATDLVVSGHTSSIEGLQGTVSDQGTAITGLRTDVDGNTGSINTINSLIGNGEPTTTDKTLIGAINELDAGKASSASVSSAISAVENKLGDYQLVNLGVVEAAFDGVKTVGAVLKEALDALVTFVKADAQYLKRLKVTDIIIDGVGALKCYDYPMIICNPGAQSDFNGLIASQFSIGATSYGGVFAAISSSNYNDVVTSSTAAADSAVTITDKTSDVPVSGSVHIKYEIFDYLGA